MLTLYHASPHLFRKPTYDALVRNRSNHANGNLGLWFSTSPDWIKGFGIHVYSFQLADDAAQTGIDISIGDLKQMDTLCFEERDYQEKRIELMSQGHQFIRIIEKNGLFDMGIVLDFDIISDFGLMAAKTSRKETRNESKQSRHNQFTSNLPV